MISCQANPTYFHPWLPYYPYGNPLTISNTTVMIQLSLNNRTFIHRNPVTIFGVVSLHGDKSYVTLL